MSAGGVIAAHPHVPIAGACLAFVIRDGAACLIKARRKGRIHRCGIQRAAAAAVQSPRITADGAARKHVCPGGAEGSFVAVGHSRVVIAHLHDRVRVAAFVGINPIPILVKYALANAAAVSPRRTVFQDADEIAIQNLGMNVHCITAFAHLFGVDEQRVAGDVAPQHAVTHVACTRRSPDHELAIAQALREPAGAGVIHCNFYQWVAEYVHRYLCCCHDDFGRAEHVKRHVMLRRLFQQNYVAAAWDHAFRNSPKICHVVPLQARITASIAVVKV